MTSTKATPIVWAFRTLAITSSAFAAWHFVPILDATPPGHAVLLSQAEGPIFAAEGVRRITRQAHWGPKARKKLIEAGAVPALANAAARGDHAMATAVVKAAGALVEDEEIAERIIEEGNIVDLLLEGNEAVRVWRRILQHERVRGRLKGIGICARVAEGGDNEVRTVLVEGGDC